MTTAGEVHFDGIAAQYDYWKQKNWYYYQNLIALYREHIQEGSDVLEIGCGTGDVLAALKPRRGRGVDISAEMAAIAARKYKDQPHLTFERHDIFESNEPFAERYVFLADVLEHVDDLPLFLKQLARRTSSDARVVISVANPLWEPVLMLAEKLGMKMPEGPHKRYSIRATERLMREAGYAIEKRGFRLLVPKPIWGSDWLNARFHAWPVVRSIGFVVFWSLRK